ncbi:Protein kinase superfamily protein, partial [Prunus dulcis]
MWLNCLLDHDKASHSFKDSRVRGEYGIISGLIFVNWAAVLLNGKVLVDVHADPNFLVAYGNQNMSRVSRQRSVRVEPGWLYKGGDQGFSASSERSESADEDILIFFFLLDLATRVQTWSSLLDVAMIPNQIEMDSSTVNNL